MIRNRQWLPRLGFGTVLVLLAACDSGDVVQAPVLTSVEVTPSTGSIALGDTTRLVAEARDQNGSPMSGKTFTWSTSDPDIATVDAEGLVTSVNGGTVTITATVEGMDGTASVSVTTPTLASEWVGAVDWDQKTIIEVQMVEAAGGAVLSYSPNALTLQAGRPYVLRIINAATNTSKHYFSPKGSSFYQAIATRKIETADAEYKAPYFDAVELLIGGSLDIYFVPVTAGTYDIICTITGHEAAGMTATATITGGTGFQLDLEIATDFNQALTTDARKSGGHAVWAAAVDTTVAMFESSTFDQLGYAPPNMQLTSGVGYKFEIMNPSSHVAKHYYTAEEFYKSVVLRKAEDSQAEIKAPYLKAVELLIGGTTTLFIVPTAAGTYTVICTITGHVALGMTGTVVVS